MEENLGTETITMSMVNRPTMLHRHMLKVTLMSILIRSIIQQDTKSLKFNMFMHKLATMLQCRNKLDIKCLAKFWRHQPLLPMGMALP